MESSEYEFKVQDYRASDVLKDDQLIALGRVVAEFGILEASIKGSGLRIYFDVVGLTGHEFRYLTANPQLSAFIDMMLELVPRRLQEFPVDQTLLPRDVRQTRAPFPQVAELFVEQLKIAKQLSGRRNDIVHAAWGNVDVVRGLFRPTKSDSQFGWLTKGKQKPRPHSFNVSAADMNLLAEDIAACRHEFNRAIGALPPPVGFGIPL